MFQISSATAAPIYRQIVDQVRREVLGGQLKPGDELPSVRSVALKHAINPMTVSKAYSLLEAEGLLVRQRGMAMAVAEQASTASHQQRQVLLRPHLEAAARAAHQLKVSPEAALELFSAYLKTHEKKDAS